jgi:hypothetical protein
MCACESTTASIERASNGNVRLSDLGFGAAALEEPAVEQETLAVLELDQVLRAGHRAGGAVEGDAHR